MLSKSHFPLDELVAAQGKRDGDTERFNEVQLVRSTILQNREITRHQF